MRSFNKKRRRPIDAGMTLLELIVACAILMLLSSVALPMQRYALVRQRESELRQGLLQMRQAIDRYKDYCDRGMIRKELDSECYPPDLQTLVTGVSIGLSGATGKNVRFLRRVPVDPIVGNDDWGLRAVGDAPDSTSWGGKNVFDVYSKSTATAMDGTKYSDW